MEQSRWDHSFVPSSVACMEGFLCPRYCAGPWGCSRGQLRGSLLTENKQLFTHANMFTKAGMSPLKDRNGVRGEGAEVFCTLWLWGSSRGWGGGWGLLTTTRNRSTRPEKCRGDTTSSHHSLFSIWVVEQGGV